MATLVIPGVSVQAHFDVLPPQPSPSGIIGIVGVVDRVPSGNSLVGVSKISELREILGPGSIFSLRQGVNALANGAVELIVSPVSGGSAASLTLLNVDSNPAVLLRCRFNRSWGTSLAAEVRTILDSSGNVLRVTLSFLVAGQVEETFPDLRVAPGEPDDLFTTINKQSNLVVAMDAGFGTDLPTPGSYPFNVDGDPIDVVVNSGTDTLFQIVPADDTEPNGLRTVISLANDSTISLDIFNGSALQEEHSGLVMDPDSDNYLPFLLLTQSRFIRVIPQSSLSPSLRLPVATSGPASFATDGVAPSVENIKTAINALEEDMRIEMVLAEIEPTRSNAETSEIHQALLSHAVSQSDKGAPRVAAGSITVDEAGDLGKIKDHASAVRNRRFVLVAPPEATGAVAGMIGRMNAHESPTFKSVPLHGTSPSTYRESQLNKLLGSTINLCVVQERTGRGIIVLKGINTIGDQISVTRVADKAIRETKAISENFIGILNSEEARIALKQQIIATFTRMERDGLLVPSTDGTDPAFIVDVYSSQTDFALGIVRIEIAVRPVRAIDYIYATIRVKN